MFPALSPLRCPNLPTTVVATAVGGSGSTATSNVITNADGTFEAFLTLTGGPGISSVQVTTRAAGASGVAQCAANTSSGQIGPQTTTYQGTLVIAPNTYSLCISIIGTSVSVTLFSQGSEGPPSCTGSGTGTTAGGVIISAFNTFTITFNSVASSSVNVTLARSGVGSATGDIPSVSQFSSPCTNACGTPA